MANLTKSLKKSKTWKKKKNQQDIINGLLSNRDEDHLNLKARLVEENI